MNYNKKVRDELWSEEDKQWQRLSRRDKFKILAIIDHLKRNDTEKQEFIELFTWLCDQPFGCEIAPASGTI